MENRQIVFLVLLLVNVLAWLWVVFVSKPKELKHGHIRETNMIYNQGGWSGLKTHENKGYRVFVMNVPFSTILKMFFTRRLYVVAPKNGILTKFHLYDAYKLKEIYLPLWVFKVGDDFIKVKAGAKVYHDVFGECVLKDISGLDLCTISMTDKVFGGITYKVRKHQLTIIKEEQ